jgi:hypothetical protein
MKDFRMRLRAGPMLPLLAIALASMVAGWSDSRAGVTVAYSIDFHTFSSGGSALRNSCFGLIGTVGQAAPGYSSTTSGAPMYSIYAGFWSAAPAAVLDEIFFTGFEGC